MFFGVVSVQGVVIFIQCVVVSDLVRLHELILVENSFRISKNRKARKMVLVDKMYNLEIHLKLLIFVCLNLI